MLRVLAQHRYQLRVLRVLDRSLASYGSQGRYDQLLGADWLAP